MFEQYILKVAWTKFDATHADACKKKSNLKMTIQNSAFRYSCPVPFLWLSLMILDTQK